MDEFKPSAFTPFLRRFTDERATDLRDTKMLYNEVLALHRASAYSQEDAIHTIGGELYRSYAEWLPEDVLSACSYLLARITRAEAIIFRFPEIEWDIVHLTLKEQVDLRRFLRSKQYFHTHEERVVALFQEGTRRLFEVLTYGVPQTLGPSPFTVPIVNTLNEPRLLIDRLYEILCDQKYIDHGLFVELRERCYANLCRASNAVPHTDHKGLKHAMDRDDPISELVNTYLAGTPFPDYLMCPIPLKLTHEDRYSHMHVVGGSGAGKTTLLQNLILHDLQSEDRPALIIIDSQGDLIGKLSRLALFDPETGPLRGKLILITPKDIQYPPAVNIFDVNRERLGSYDEATKEQVVAGVIQTFDYLFAGLLGADLSAKQGVFFRVVARLMLTIPETMGRNATILDMINLMDRPDEYREAIKSLPPIQRNFFERDFASKTFVQTKEQIRYRLNAILENPTLARLFTSPSTKIDLFTELNNDSIILVDTAKDFLKGASAHFGRIFISLVLQAVLERAAIPEEQRRPAFLIVDEAAAYFDSNIDDLLTEARKYKVGCVFAHQFLDQCTQSLRASLAANTSIKMAGGVSMSDARAMAPDLRTTADFILSQPKLHFACHIRNVTPQAVSVPIPVGVLENQPRLSHEAYEKFQELNRVRVSLPKNTRGDAFTMKADGFGKGEVKSKPTDDPTKPSTEW
jgi:hypothetical protein